MAPPTSFGSKMKRRLRKIWICTDVLMDILPFFDRPQLGLKLALLSPRFEVLVDAHFNGKTELTIWRTIAIDKNSVAAVPKLSVFFNKNCGFSVGFPLPDRPLPNKIRFCNLRIEYIDHSVISFLRSNKQIFDNGIILHLNIPPNLQAIWDVFVREFLPIFAPNIRHLDFSHPDELGKLFRLISPTILSNLGIHSIDSADLLPDLIADDGPNSTAGQALSKWLHIPRKCGQPKRVRCGSHYVSEATECVNNFKELFIRAVTSANYSIAFSLYKPSTQIIVPFELVNERTQERLTLSKESEDKWFFRWVMKRCPIGETADQWEDENWDGLSTVLFEFLDDSVNNCLGPSINGWSERRKSH